MTNNPKVVGLNRLVNANSKTIYMAAIDFVAYRIAWHLHQIELKEKKSYRG